MTEWAARKKHRIDRAGIYLYPTFVLCRCLISSVICSLGYNDFRQHKFNAT